MKILAFDISSVSTGYALIDNGAIVIDGYGLIIPNQRKCQGERLSYFSRSISKIINKYKPDIIAIEDIFKGRNIITFKSLSMFRGVAIRAIYEKIKRDPISIMAVTARSLLGTGITKEDSFKTIVKKYNFDFDFEKDNDVVDAIILGLAINKMEEQGLDEKSIRNSRRKKRRKRR